MSEINLPTKTTQDAIKLQTDKMTDVKNKTDLIGVANPSTANTATIMNYLKQLENKITNISGGTDWSVYQQRQISGSFTPTSNVYSTILAVNGGGALIHAEANGSNSGIQFSGLLRITIDDVVVFHGRTAATSASYTGVTVTEGSSPLGLTHPYINISANTSSFVNLYRPLFFHNSLKIESTIAGSSTSQSYNIKYLLK